MNKETSGELTVKKRYEDCKGFECPRLVELCQTDEQGNKYFVEGDLAYRAITLCNLWALGLSDGNCPIRPTQSEA